MLHPFFEWYRRAIILLLAATAGILMAHGLVVLSLLSMCAAHYLLEEFKGGEK